MTAEVKQSMKVKQIVSDLFSKDEKLVLKSIKLLESAGNPNVLTPMCEVYMETESLKVKNKILEFLNKLIDTDSIKVMVEIIRDEKFLPVRRDLLSTVWQNKMDFSDYLADFVAIASEGNFFEAFECWTIIENLEGPFQEAQVLESQLYLKEFLETEMGKSEQKDQIISDIAVLLKDFDRAIGME